MTRLIWDVVGERIYEVGVDHGVLYIDNEPGIPWNGLISINELHSGGEAEAFYIDGIKYLNRVSGEEFEAVIEAFTYPDEFAPCDGALSLSLGLSATQQKRKSFGLVYRTKIGNDVNGDEHGYKIHLVYDAIVAPSERVNSTITDSIDPLNFSWTLTARPPVYSGFKPTAHFVIDSLQTSDDLLIQIENVLYGSDEEISRLPTIEEIINHFTLFNSGFMDSGFPETLYFNIIDAGVIPEVQTSTIDGGGP